MSTRIILWLAAAAALLLPSCSSSPTAGGGSDLPNGALAVVTGTVLLPDSTPAVDAEVVLRKVVVTAEGDSVCAETVVAADSAGAFTIEDVAAGRYVLLASNDSDLAAFNQFVEVGDSGETAVAPLRLCRTVDLMGFVELPPGYYYSNMTVSIPGTGRMTRVDLNRMYLLEDVPQGEYDIALNYDDISNYLRVQVRHCTGPDSIVQVRNMRFAVLEVMGQPGHIFHETVVPHNYAVVPIQYEHGQEPAWYGSIDLSRVVYYEWNGDMPVEWTPGGQVPVPPYDALVSGMMYRDRNDQILLETSDGLVYTLIGPMVAFAGPAPVAVTAAVIVRINGSGPEYEVVDIYLQD